MTRRRRAVTSAVVLALAACGSPDDAAVDVAGSESPGDPIPGVVPDVDVDAGDRLPDVDVESLAGREIVSLREIEGPAVVNLWATWCAPCRREIPDFESVHQARGAAVRFVGVNIGEDAERALEFLAEVGATYDQFLDPEGYVVTELRATTMPVTLVLDRNGVVSTRHLGPMDQAALDEAIDAALSGR